MATFEGVIDDEVQVKLIEAIENVRNKLTYTGAVERKYNRCVRLSFFHKANGFEANDDWSFVIFV